MENEKKMDQLLEDLRSCVDTRRGFKGNRFLRRFMLLEEINILKK